MQSVKSVMLILDVFGMKCLTDKLIDFSLHALLTSHFIQNAVMSLSFNIRLKEEV